jgi:hypothetical protein
LGDLLWKLDLASIDDAVVEKAKGSFAVNVRALDAIHVATAEILAGEAPGSRSSSERTMSARRSLLYPAV